MKCVGNALLLAFVSAQWGCGDGPEYPHASITGSVTVNGKLVEKGSITCYPENRRNGGATTAPIVAGQYHLAEIPQGNNVFTFSASAETGRSVPGPGGAPEPERINIIPQRFGREGMQRQITGDGVQNFVIDKDE